MRRNTLLKYYARRAAEYDRIYDKPERQDDLDTLRRVVREFSAGTDLLELASGTGYWTAVAAESARSIIALDANEAVLEIAKAKAMGPSPVRFMVGDAYQPPGGAGAILASFWWSHIPQKEISRFLRGLRAALTPGGAVLVIDNLFVAGSSTPISRTDDDGNTYQQRRLDDGSTFEVLKNFPTGRALTRSFEAAGFRVDHTPLTYYWHAQARLAD